MKAHELASARVTVVKDVDDIIHDVIEKALLDFKSGKDLSNADTMTAFKNHGLMLEYEFTSVIASGIKKATDKLKGELDKAAGEGSEGQAGDTVILLEDGSLRFQKKRNKDSTRIDWTEFKNQLSRMGVDADILAKAEVAATKEKRGNVYYQIEACE